MENRRYERICKQLSAVIANIDDRGLRSPECCGGIEQVLVYLLSLLSVHVPSPEQLRPYFFA